MIQVQTLKAKLSDFADTDDVTCCKCGEELLIFRDNHQIGIIKMRLS